MSTISIEHADNYRLETIKKTLRKCFDDLGYPSQNPLGGGIHPGDKVFIKPNWVASRWRKSCPHKDDLYCVITHPSIIEGVADFVAEALCGKGEIIIGDNPSIDADFAELLEFTEIEKIKNKYDVPVSILDLRPLVCDDLKNYGKKDLMVPQTGDPLGEVQINLGKESLLYGIDPSRFRGVFDEREDTVAAHTGETQIYTFAKSLYESDVYISLPKLKTHQKVGATINLKGLVGAVSNKNQLVHWQVGYPEVHGDEYPDKKSYEEGLKAKVRHRGAWPGNDTIWRMVVDLYKCMNLKQRKYFTVVDGIMAGEGQGPFCVTSKHANTLIAGEDLLSVDCASVRYMGLDPHKISYLKYFIENQYEGFTLDDISVVEQGKVINKFFEQKSNYLDFYVVDLWENIKYNYK